MTFRHYVVQTQFQRELLAVQELGNQGFETFFPQLQRPRRVIRGVMTLPPPAPLFPRYVFVGLDTATDAWRSVNGTRGVVRLMTMNELPVPVPQAVMRRLIDAGSMIEEETAGLPFDPGDTVEFTSGSMLGLRALVKLCTADRVTVLLDMMGRKTTVHAPPSLLRYTSPA